MNFNQIIQRGGGIVRGGVSIAARLGQQVTGSCIRLASAWRPEPADAEV